MIENKVASNVIWRFFERCGSQVITFIVTTILARILTPDDYGTLTLVLVFITIMQVFVDSGMGSALIQKKNADHLDFSTVFYFNFFVSVGLYLLMVLAAPLISAFYDEPELTPIIRVLSLMLIASGARNVQQAYVARYMQFKRFFYATIIGTIVSGALGIWMAYYGFGIWAMVARQLSNVVIDTIVLWLVVEWKPKWEFSFHRLKQLLSFGWKILATGLLDVVYNNARQLLIGKLYTPVDLAYNSKGKQIPEIVGTNVNMAIDGVLLPTMSAVQDKLEQVKKIMRKATQINCYIMTPLMIGLACVAEPVIKLLLTDKWLNAVPYMQIFCVVYLFYSHQLTNRNALKSIGRSDVVLKLEIVNKVIGFSGLLISMWFGVWAITVSLLITTCISQIIISTINHIMFQYRFAEQLKDSLPPIALSIVMGGGVYTISLLPLPVIVSLLLQVCTGAIIYILLSVFLRMSAFMYVWGIIKSFVKKRR